MEINWESAGYLIKYQLNMLNGNEIIQGNPDRKM